MAEAVCPNCANTLPLPDDWPHAGVTCPYCKTAVALVVMRPKRSRGRDANRAGFEATMGVLRALAVVVLFLVAGGITVALVLLALSRN